MGIKLNKNVLIPCLLTLIKTTLRNPNTTLSAFWIIALLFFWGSTSAYAQYSDEQVKVAFVQKFAENVEWPKEPSKYRIGVFKDQAKMLSLFQQLAERKKINGKRIEVIPLDNLNKLPAMEILYLNEGRNKKAETAADKCRSKHILLVSENILEKEFVQINFTKKEEKVSFEINKPAIIFAGITPKKELLLLGGTEVDVRQLYKQIESKAANMRSQLRDQQAQLQKQKESLAKQEAQIQEQQQSIADQKEEIRKQNAEIETQKASIAKQQKELNKLQASIIQKEEALQEKVSELAEKEEAVKEKEALLAEQKNEEAEQRKVLAELEASIDEREAEINAQRLTLAEQTGQIALQQNALLVFAGFAVIILALLFWVYRANQKSKKANKELARSNAEIQKQHDEIKEQSAKIQIQKEEILSQNEELKQQQDEILAINEAVEGQRKELFEKNVQITDSIRYALTIQNAILPSHASMRELFSEYFLYFKAKDIVSGDFYWASQQEGFRVAAVIDCTGHGVPGAFMSLIGNNLINGGLNNLNLQSPAEVITYMDKGVARRLDQDKGTNRDGMELGMCFLREKDADTVEVTFAGTKNNLIIYDRGDLQILRGDRASVGGGKAKPENFSFTDHVVEVSKKATLYLTTDGYIDMPNKKRERFGTRRYLQLIADIHPLSLEEQKARFESALEEFSQGEPQRDDMTVMVIRP